MLDRHHYGRHEMRMKHLVFLHRVHIEKAFYMYICKIYMYIILHYTFYYIFITHTHTHCQIFTSHNIIIPT